MLWICICSATSWACAFMHGYVIRLVGLSWAFLRLYRVWLGFLTPLPSLDMRLDGALLMRHLNRTYY
jgi:hypothetical protein